MIRSGASQNVSAGICAQSLGAQQGPPIQLPPNFLRDLQCLCTHAVSSTYRPVPVGACNPDTLEAAQCQYLLYRSLEAIVAVSLLGRVLALRNNKLQSHHQMHPV